MKNKSNSGSKSKELSQIKEFIELIRDADITELLWEKNGMRISFKRGAWKLEGEKELAQREAATSEELSEIASANPKVAEEARLKTKEEVPSFSERYTTIKSRMVGTFYNSLSEDQPPLVKVKDIIKPGQKICVIETMKIMREISADKGGRVIKILVENGHPVEYDQDMFLIDPHYEEEEVSKAPKKKSR